jgi:hypothetical protein
MVSEHGRLEGATAVGGCGCGGVTFAVDPARAVSAEPDEWRARVGWWGLRVGDDGVDLLTGWEHLVRTPGEVPRLRCGRCGVDVFAEAAAGLEVNARCVPG